MNQSRKAWQERKLHVASRVAIKTQRLSTCYLILLLLVILWPSFLFTAISTDTITRSCPMTLLDRYVAYTPCPTVTSDSPYPSIKPFWPLLFTIVLPRAYGYFNALKTAYRTRPPPTPLPPRVNRTLNILFCSILFFLVQSFPRGSDRDIHNVFSTIITRLGVPTDVLFARLAMMRPSTMLTAMDDALRQALVTKEYALVEHRSLI